MTVKYGSLNEEEKISTEKSLDELTHELGLGKAHCLVWSILACIMMIQNMVYLLTTVLMPYLTCNWELSGPFETAIGSALSITFCLSGIFLGNLADNYGRKKIIIITSITHLLCGILAAVSPNGTVFLLVRALQGMCNGVGGHVCYVLAVEIVGFQYKELAVFVIVFSSQVGGLFLSLMAYFLLNTKGWRYLCAALMVPLLPGLIGLLVVPESPRYLFVKGKTEEAIVSLRTLYRWNSISFPESYSGKNAVKLEKRAKIAALFRQGYTKTTIFVTAMFTLNYCIYLTFAGYLPLDSDRSLDSTTNIPVGLHKCGNSLDQAALIGTLVAFSGDAFGSILAGLAGRKIGRILMLKSLGFLTLLTIISIYFDLNAILKNMLNMMVRLGVTGFRQTLFYIAVEAYPTVLRSTASGFTSCFGEVGAIFGSFVTYSIYPVSPVAVVSLMVGAAVVQFVLAMLWDTETKENALTDSKGEKSECCDDNESMEYDEILGDKSVQLSK